MGDEEAGPEPQTRNPRSNGSGRGGPSVLDYHVSENATAWILLGAALVIHGTIVGLLTGSFALDVDPVNLAYGMKRFVIEEHSPHPPGYWLYIQTLRALHAMVGGGDSLAGRFATTQSLSLIFSSGSIVLLFSTVRRLRPLAPELAGLGALLAAFNPFLVFHAVDAQTHNSEAFAGALLLLLLVRYHQGPVIRRAALLGLALALGSAFRPTFVVLGVVPIVLACRKRPAHLLVAGAAAMTGALGWIAPTLAASGGYGKWKVANDALVGQTFVNSISPLSPAGVPELQSFQLRTTATWLALLLAPLVVAFLVRLWQTRHWSRQQSPGPDIRPGEAAVPGSPDERKAGAPVGAWTLAACLPLFAFCSLTFCSEPGYLNGAIPFLIASILVMPASDQPRSSRVFAPVAALAVSIALLFAPSMSGAVAKMPTITELIERTIRVGAWLDEVDRRVPPGKVLIVGDLLDITVLRQASLQRSRVHYLHFASAHWPVFERTTASLATEDGWLPIPGPAHLVHGPPKIQPVPWGYDWVLIDRWASAHLRSAVKLNLSCPGDAGEYREFALFPAHCFLNNEISLDGQGIRFQPGPSPPGER